jgi:hypothetical protein
MKVEVCDPQRSPYPIHEVEVNGKFAAATINEDIVIIYVKGDGQAYVKWTR